MTNPGPTFVDPEEELEHQRQNMLQSALLLAGICAIVALSAVLMFGPIGIIWTVAMIALIFALAPRIPPETVMRIYRAQQVNYARNPQIGNIIATLSKRAELTTPPRIYVIPSMTLNAFATGTPTNAVIAITEGMFRRLTMREVVGVLAHEISHIRNNDLWIMALADVMTRITQLLSYTALFLAILNIFALASGEQYVSWYAVAMLYLAPHPIKPAPARSLAGPRVPCRSARRTPDRRPHGPRLRTQPR